MKIGFDISQTGKSKAGCGHFASSLIHALAEIDSQNEYVLYPTFGDAFWDPHAADGTTRIDQPNFHLGHASGSQDEARCSWRTDPNSLWKHIGSPDIVHSNNFFCPRLPPQARLVYTLYDLAFLQHPEWTTEANRLACFDGMFPATTRADAIIAISNYTRDHFRKVFPHFPEERLHVIYPGSRFAGHGPIPHRPHALSSVEPRGYWLSVATIEPRKNHMLLLKAYAELVRNHPNTRPLVLTGGAGWLMSHFEDTIASMGLQGHVRLTGYVDDTSLQWLYENCFGFVYPSLFEGFGLPVLEAMSCGAPVIASSSSSLPEIVGDAGLLIDPRDAQHLTSAMHSVENGLVNTGALSHAARLRSQDFSCSKAAEQLLTIYATLVTHGPAAKKEASHCG